jgi:hypothetical protein
LPQDWTEPLIRPTNWIWDMGFGTWNERRVYRSGSLSTVAKEFVRYKLDFEGRQEDG